MAPGRSIYYSNRALCHLKLEKWDRCRDDCQSALKFDALNAKASYMLGTSYMQLLAFDMAVEALIKALKSAKKTQKSASFQNDIVAELKRVKKCQWHHEQQQRIARHTEAMSQLRRLFGEKQTDKVLEVDALMAYMEHMAQTFEKDMYPGEVPDYFMCPISMEVTRDPVTTPNGVSYVTKLFYGCELMILLIGCGNADMNDTVWKNICARMER